MPYRIAGIDHDDAAGVSRNNTTAFYQMDPRWRALWGSTPLEDIIAGATARMPHSLMSGRTKKRYQKAVDETTGEIVEYAHWILPDDDESISWLEASVREPTQEEAERFKAEYEANINEDGVPSMNSQLQAALGMSLEETETALMRDQKGPFLRGAVLEYLAVHPDHRRRGIASALVESGLNQADLVGMKVWVMATTSAQPIYEQLGFEHLRTVATSVTDFGIVDPHKKAFLLRR